MTAFWLKVVFASCLLVTSLKAMAVPEESNQLDGTNRGKCFTMPFI